MTDCVSGSPKRQLYSSTRAPSAVSISPANSVPTNGGPRRASSARIGPPRVLAPPGPIGREHQPGEQRPDERRSPARELRQDRPDGSVDDLVEQLAVERC